MVYVRIVVIIRVHPHTGPCFLLFQCSSKKIYVIKLRQREAHSNLHGVCFVHNTKKIIFLGSNKQTNKQASRPFKKIHFVGFVTLFQQMATEQTNGIVLALVITSISVVGVCFFWWYFYWKQYHLCMSPNEILAFSTFRFSAIQSKDNVYSVRVFLVKNSLHSGIALARNDIPVDIIPEIEDFPTSPFIEFGWGDAHYYPLKNSNLWSAILALVVPGPSVMQMIGLPDRPEITHPDAVVLSFRVTKKELDNVLRYLHTSFDRQNRHRATILQPGHHDKSFFYPATGSFHYFNTCNSWTSQAFVQMGFPQAMMYGINTASDLVKRLASLTDECKPPPNV